MFGTFQSKKRHWDSGSTLPLLFSSSKLVGYASHAVPRKSTHNTTTRQRQEPLDDISSNSILEWDHISFQIFSVDTKFKQKQTKEALDFNKMSVLTFWNNDEPEAKSQDSSIESRHCVLDSLKVQWFQWRIVTRKLAISNSCRIDCYAWIGFHSCHFEWFVCWWIDGCALGSFCVPKTADLACKALALGFFANGFFTLSALFRTSGWLGNRRKTLRKMP